MITLTIIALGLAAPTPGAILFGTVLALLEAAGLYAITSRKEPS